MSERPVPVSKEAARTIVERTYDRSGMRHLRQRARVAMRMNSSPHPAFVVNVVRLVVEKVKTRRNHHAKEEKPRPEPNQDLTPARAHDEPAPRRHAWSAMRKNGSRGQGSDRRLGWRGLRRKRQPRKTRLGPAPIDTDEPKRWIAERQPSSPLCGRRHFHAAITLGVVILAFIAAPAPARAHDESVSSSEVEVRNNVIIWRVDVGIGGLAKVVPLPPEGTLDEKGLAAAAGPIGRYLAAGLDVMADGMTLPVTIGTLEPRFEPTGLGSSDSLARAVQTLSFQSPHDISRLTVNVHFFSELTPSHRALVRVVWQGELTRLTRLGPAEITLERGHVTPGVAALIWEFGRWGTHHIFVGYDHIAFLVALLLAVTRWRTLVTIVTSFTVAHSLTLLASALDLVRIPSRLTEVLIAASIVYVAGENLFARGRAFRHRAFVTFAFGLVHGLGFASQLRARLAEIPGRVVLPVLSFNLGVELGQLAIVSIVFPLLVRLRQGPTESETRLRERRLMRMGSIPVLLFGLFWLCDRLLG